MRKMQDGRKGTFFPSKYTRKIHKTESHPKIKKASMNGIPKVDKLFRQNFLILIGINNKHVITKIQTTCKLDLYLPPITKISLK